MEVETYWHARFVVGLECNQLLLFSPETCVGILWMVWAYKNSMWIDRLGLKKKEVNCVFRVTQPQKCPYPTIFSCLFLSDCEFYIISIKKSVFKYYTNQHS